MAIKLSELLSVQALVHPLLEHKQLSVGMLRLDEVHPLVSGNKWFKLKENIVAATAEGKRELLTFGGAYSNHLLATAAAASALHMPATAMVRGFHGRDKPTPTLQQCQALGMQMHYVSREAYARKTEPQYLQQLQSQYPDAFIIPEGGDNEYGLLGAGDIANYIPADTDMVALPVGTGTTFAGLRNRLANHIPMLGFTAMKGGHYLDAVIAGKLLPDCGAWHLNDDYHFGGFAKYNDALIDFMNSFYTVQSIPLDMVYTAKMMYGIFDLAAQDFFPPGIKLCCIHTGGLQGNSAVSQYLQYS